MSEQDKPSREGAESGTGAGEGSRPRPGGQPPAEAEAARAAAGGGAGAPVVDQGAGTTTADTQAARPTTVAAQAGRPTTSGVEAGRTHPCAKNERITPATDRLSRLADFLFEVGMLRRTPRTGYQFLCTGAENVAEHSFRTAVIGVVLARMAGADVGRTALLGLFHDLHEARTGDFNYVAKIYKIGRAHV